MEQIQAQMAALKRQREEAKAVALGGAPVKKKYLRRGEIEAALEEKERMEAAAAAERAEQEQNAKDGETTNARISSDGAKETSQASTTVAEDTTQDRNTSQQAQLNLSLSEIKKRLRNLGHPVTLFGETAQDRANRLEALIHSTQGGEMEIQADKDDKEVETEENKDENSDEMIVYRYFKSMLSQWELALGQRPETVKRTAQGKIATRTMKQCKDYIRPLFRLCKHHEVPDDILRNLLDIVRYCESGEFVQANDAYIKMAIGNAAWPIGVTMVGIHERTGREKINSNKQAHVMNNELQRKYLTSVKRLISYAQSISNVAPSKKVL
ncbi:hypothetical protein H310_10370 [Aphanomyces invadans]|nr:hypothetical protein H310_10370 [Aphanomyces invadans]ETV96170.1 hypothetical protein H310_10370 [Aphanomyces invadans]|eukprot:XP_008874962.1 hypothetical protein H310_10370 [Aphanomyces invadans]